MAGSEVMVQFADLTGQKANMKFFSDTIEDVNDQAGLVTAIDGVSDAAIIGIVVTAAAENDVGTAEDGPYATNEDRAEFVFQGGGGAYYHIGIPAPDEAIFGPDKETVDQTVPAVDAFISAIIANAVDPNGGTLTYIKGYRIKTRTKQS